ncbi:hypothetical protein [Psychrobacter aquimaris]|uniref:hypothetical protein n=1 Tax=Psychrobacter aquimaris TaxID=292733 RepID=UPI003FD5CD5D
MQINISTMALIAMLSINIMACSNEPSSNSVAESDAEIYEDDQDALAGDILATEKSDTESAPVAFDASLYHDINQDSDFSYIKALSLAQTDRDMFDNERLIHMYPEYQQEQDPQKREAMAKELIPKMKSEMAKYEDPYRIKVKVMSPDEGYEFGLEQEKKGLTGAFFRADGDKLRRYDFETKSFPISPVQMGGSKSPCWFPLRLTNKLQNHDSSIQPNEDCTLEISDESLAEKMSTAYISLTGMAYYRIEDITAFPERVDLVFSNSETGEEYATKTFTWSY